MRQYTLEEQRRGDETLEVERAMITMKEEAFRTHDPTITSEGGVGVEARVRYACMGCKK